MKLESKEDSLPYLFDVMQHELNSIRTVLLLWNAEIPPPVRRSIAQRVRNQERITKKLQRLLQ